ncbi:MAG: hypothetical protein M1361_00245 [Patescibacteria group bacterium]|nr:hypothetical protein [Patescibacteria group bacterium]MCL5224046.1 hypothetical protein [Patescibacteria group bacterium]
MIKIEGRDIWRDGSKVGWIEGDYVRASDGSRLGYFDSHYIYNSSGSKVAYVQGAYLCSNTEDKKIPLDKVNEQVSGGMISDIARCAVYVLL